jgi:dynein heavy chain
MVEVEKKKGETNVLIQKVSEESGAAEIEKAGADEEEEKTNVAAKEAGDLKEQAEKSLANAIPALERAKNAIDCIKKGHITEMKSMGSPPAMVVVTAKVIMILLGEKVSPNDAEDKVWKKAVQMMNNPDKFLQTVKTYNGDTIDQSILDQC